MIAALLAVCVVLAWAAFLALCASGADADARVERAYQNWLRTRR